MADCIMSSDNTLNLTGLFGLTTVNGQIYAFHNRQRNLTECKFESDKFDYGLEPGVQISLLCFYVVSLILAVGGNFTVLYIIVKFLSRSPTKTFICSLCFSDIVLFLACVPVTVISDLIYLYWPFCTILCPIKNFLQVATVMQRALTLLVMTLDKHYVAWMPLGRRLSHKSAKIVIVCIWAVSGAIAAPSAMYSSVIYLEFEPGSNGLCTEVWPDIASQSKYTYALLTLQYILPVFVMGCSYSHIARIVWAKTPPGEKMLKRDRRIAKNKRKTLKMLMVVVIAYVVCWLPLHILTLIGEQNPSIFNNKLVHYLWLLAHWLATSNSALNPIVYFWMNPVYRAGFKRICSSLRMTSDMSPSKRRKNTLSVFYMISSNKYLTLCLSSADTRSDSDLIGVSESSEQRYTQKSETKQCSIRHEEEIALKSFGAHRAVMGQHI